MSDDTTTAQLVVFTLGDEEYGLPIAAVHEIIRYTEPRAVGASASWVRGVISLRGQIIPVYDLAGRLGTAQRSADGEHKIVIVQTGADMAGVIVDEVAEILTVDAEQLDAMPSIDRDSVDAVVKLGDRLVVLLNLAGLFGGASEFAAV
jgi:purine-binding chemotaxis protein CheW